MTKPSVDTPTRQGHLISFEGSEGSGKTTQIERLVRHLEKIGHKVIVTREPGGTPIGEQVRHLLKHAAAGEKMFPETELLLFAASRAQLVREVIIPGLQEGAIIICDRYLDSTTVYQGAARNLSAEPLQVINEFAVGEVVPELTFVLDIDPEIGLNRIKARGSGKPDRMERENIEFYRKVRQGYLMLVEALPERFCVLEADQEVDLIEDEIWEEVKRRFDI
jgi:dTMP kinase